MTQVENTVQGHEWHDMTVNMDLFERIDDPEP